GHPRRLRHPDALPTISGTAWACRGWRHTTTRAVLLRHGAASAPPPHHETASALRGNGRYPAPRRATVVSRKGRRVAASVAPSASSARETSAERTGPEESQVSQIVDFVNVSTAGLESSPVAEALAGLRA